MQWPEDRPCAAVLTHDVDVLHDRELFRVLADGNHLRRMLFSGERGHIGSCVRRLVRNCLRPRHLGRDMRHLRSLERAHGFRSSFYFLIDRPRPNRNGGRYQIEEPAVAQLIRELVEEGCEVGVHGSYFDFNHVGYLTECRKRLESVSGTHVVGIRNHQLQFSGLQTWRAQVKAGFEYDATWGLNEKLGPLGGIALPFSPTDRGSALPILELPLTVMDTTLFRWMALDQSTAARAVEEHVEWLARTGSLGVFLWHNNFFLEPEYSDWEAVYEVLLQSLERVGAWVATGAEVATWWQQRSNVEIRREISEQPDGRASVTFVPRRTDRGIRIPVANGAADRFSVEDPQSAHLDNRGPDSFLLVEGESAVATFAI